MFKSKRANIYNAGVSLDNRMNYKPKTITKTDSQTKFICTALDQSFAFSSLNEIEKLSIAGAMERIKVVMSEDLITQGNVKISIVIFPN
jgi:hypothetical protein